MAVHTLFCDFALMAFFKPMKFCIYTIKARAFQVFCYCQYPFNQWAAAVHNSLFLNAYIISHASRHTTLQPRVLSRF